MSRQVSEIIEGVSVSTLGPPYAAEGALTSDAREFARSLMAQVTQLKAFAAQKMLPVYNDSWLDDDNGTLTQEAFESCLNLSKVSLYDELGAACVYFEAGELFGGHVIEVFVRASSPVDADLVG